MTGLAVTGLVSQREQTVVLAEEEEEDRVEEQAEQHVTELAEQEAGDRENTVEVQVVGLVVELVERKA